MAKKKKENGKNKAFVNIWKYKDAILWGAEKQGEKLPIAFYKEIELYLK